MFAKRSQTSFPSWRRHRVGPARCRRRRAAPDDECTRRTRTPIALPGLSSASSAFWKHPPLSTTGAASLARGNGDGHLGQGVVKASGDSSHRLAGGSIGQDSADERRPVGHGGIAVGEGQRVGLVLGFIGGKFQGHGRLALETDHRRQPAQRGHRVEQPSHAAGPRAVDASGQHRQQRFQLLRLKPARCRDAW